MITTNSVRPSVLPSVRPSFTASNSRIFDYFRTNSGTTDYVALAQPVELSGDFEIEWVMASSSIGTRVFGTSDSVDGRFFARLADGSDSAIQLGLLVGSTQSGLATPTGFIETGKLNTIRVSRTGSTLTVRNMSTGSVSTGTIGTETAVVDAFCRHLTNNYTGSLSDVRITSTGTPIHHWPMNKGSGSTHVDVIGGNNGTIINGQPSDWELFERLPGSNEWLGRELVTNGSGDSADGWSTVGTTSLSVESVNGELRVETAGVSGAAQTIGTTTDSVYKLSGGIRNESSFSAMIRSVDQVFNGTVLGEFVITPPGDTSSQFGYFTALSDATAVYLRVPDGVAYFDNISIRRILEIA